MNPTFHNNEIPINGGLVRRLVNAEFPHYAALPLRRLTRTGSSNVLFRLGDDLLVRLPRQPGGGAAIDKERRWLPEIGPALPITVPEVIAWGRPAWGYPEEWSILGWISGELPEVCTPCAPPTGDQERLAEDLADLILALRGIEVSQKAASDPALRWYRGRPLAEFDRQTRRNIQQCRSLAGLDLDLDTAAAVWEEAMRLPGAADVGIDHWYHSDLVAENLLLQGGRLSAVLDFGGLAVGDASVDLHGAWELFDPSARELFRARLGVDDAQWLRGRAWALGIALGSFAYYWEKMPHRMRDRLAMARSVLADAL